MVVMLLNLGLWEIKCMSSSSSESQQAGTNFNWKM